MDEEKDFEFDDSYGCSMFPEGDWHDCCVMHDVEYRDIGKGWLNWRARRRADVALYRCVRTKGHPRTAAIMFLGVRLFGFPAWAMNRWVVTKKEK